MYDERKELVMRGLEIFRDPALIDELIHPSWINHEAMAQNRYGIEGAHGSARTLNEAIADIAFEPHHVLADGDLVALHATVSGRHVGELGGVAATGRRFSVRHVHLYRIADGRLAEHWAVRDDVALLRQLGAVGEPAPAA